MKIIVQLTEYHDFV